ncbi:MAG: hypothetical protein HDR13_04680 [Lachnospiraceae bacterium]|nr:hypothetical protein [Lachnospiraceae bacterium]
MALDLIVILISVTVIGGFGFALRCDWGARMGKDLGRRHMKEIGMDDGQEEYHE